MRQTARTHRGTSNPAPRTPRTTEPEPHIRILRQADVTQLTGLSRTTIWRRVRDGSFPPPIRLGPPTTRAKGWRQTDLQDWFDNLQPTT
ncbi:MAG: AlpA family phage regulatory protein [bacterium]|nr:AlpA family phage regulatory protein [bacterium]